METWYPVAASRMPITTLPATYSAKPVQLPACIICRDSFEKEEKVVNPPQKPTLSNSIICCEAQEHRLEKPPIKPISRHPSKLTMNVAHGNPPECFIINETAYRNAPPAKLPVPTKMMFRSIFMGFLVCFQCWLSRCSALAFPRGGIFPSITYLTGKCCIPNGPKKGLPAYSEQSQP